MSPAGRAANRPGARSTRGRPVRAARPRPPRRWILPLGLAVITVVVLALYFTPLLGVRSVRVDGLTATPQQAVLEAAAVELGQPMMRVDTDDVRGRLGELPEIASAQVRLEWPSTVVLQVTERHAVAYLAEPGGARLVDEAGVAFRSAPKPPPGLPELRLGADRPAGVRAALDALTALPPELRGQVQAVSAQQPQDLSLVLTANRQVHWGDDEQAARKAAILPPLLGQPGRVYDVTSPALPTVA